MDTSNKILFVDNFRGFTNTYIPINDVNFMVGENSTGKSSILSLLKLMSSPRFWFDPEFFSEEVNLGHFNDIVSVHANDRSYFSIGHIKYIDDKNSKAGTIEACILTFVEEDGMPRLAFFAKYSNTNEDRLRITKKQTKYKRRMTKEYHNVNEFIKNIFADWVCAHKKDKLAYKLFPREFHYPAFPLFIFDSIIDRVIDKKTKNEKPLKPTLTIQPIIHDLAWLAPIRTKPLRTYDDYQLDFSPEGTHTPYLIRKILDKKTDAKHFIKFIKKVGADTGLFDTIVVKKYGRGATSPFELDIVLNKKALGINNVGYGVSQALPVIVEIFTRLKGSWFAIQQPEVHLHPKAQAALGDIFFNLAIKEDKKFIIETHSDYTISRYRLNCLKCKNKKTPNAQILYFERGVNGNKVFQIKIKSNGDLPTDQPKGYRNFFMKEAMRLLNV